MAYKRSGPIQCRKCKGEGTIVKTLFGPVLDKNGKKTGASKVVGTETTPCAECGGTGVV